LKTEDSMGRIRNLGVTAWTWVGVIVLASIVLFALYSVYKVLLPFIYALAFVYILRPVVNFLDDKGMPRILALLLSYLGMFSILALFGMYVGPIIYRESDGLISRLPDYIATTNGHINDFVRSNPYLKGEQATQFLTNLGKSFESFLEKLAVSLPGMTATLFGGILNFILAPIIAFYILKDFAAIRTTINELIPERHRIEGMQILRKMDVIVGGFLKGQALVALSVAILSGIALSILGVDYAFLLAFIIGVFNIIPYLGPIIGGAPAVIIALGTSWQLAVMVIVVLAVVQQIDSVLISPRIMSQQVNLHPAVVIFAILLGEALLGFIGMLIAIPIAAMGKAIFLHFRDRGKMMENGPDKPNNPGAKKLKRAVKV